MDHLTLYTLGKSLAQAELDLDQAKDALEKAREEFASTPLEKAEFEQEIARARKAKEDTEENLADFQRDYLRDLAGAVKAKAEQEVALDEALERLEDFQRDSNQTLAGALTAKVAAEQALDDALEELGFHGRDRDQVVADAVTARATAETALDNAKESLAEFDKDFQLALVDARLAVGDAKNTVQAAEDALTAFIRPLGRTKSFGPDDEEEENEVVRELGRLQIAVQEARTDQIQTEIELRELEGDRLLLLQARQAAVDAAQFAFQEAGDNVAEVKDLSDQHLELEKRQAAGGHGSATSWSRLTPTWWRKWRVRTSWFWPSWKLSWQRLAPSWSRPILTWRRRWPGQDPGGAGVATNGCRPESRGVHRFD